MTQWPFADSVDQDQTAQTVKSDLVSTLSDKEIFYPKNDFEIAKYWLLLLSWKFHLVYLGA